MFAFLYKSAKFVLTLLRQRLVSWPLGRSGGSSSAENQPTPQDPLTRNLSLLTCIAVSG